MDVMDQIDKGGPLPCTPKLGSHQLPQVQRLFDSEQSAHDELLEIFSEVYAELRADGVTVPAFKDFMRHFAECWKTWRLYA